MNKLAAPEVVGEDEKVILEGIRGHLVRRRFRYPHGIETWHLTGHSRPSAVIFPRTKQGDVVVLHQFRPAPNEFIIELPGGTPESAEGSTEAAERELMKESGSTAERFEVLRNRVMFDPASNLSSFAPVVATGCSIEREPELDKTEIAEPFVIPPDRFVRMIENGEVRDAKTIATTFLALMRLGHISFHF